MRVVPGPRAPRLRSGDDAGRASSHFGNRAHPAGGAVRPGRRAHPRLSPNRIRRFRRSLFQAHRAGARRAVLAFDARALRSRRQRALRSGPLGQNRRNGTMDLSISPAARHQLKNLLLCFSAGNLCFLRRWYDLEHLQERSMNYYRAAPETPALLAATIAAGCLLSLAFYAAWRWVERNPSPRRLKFGYCGFLLALMFPLESVRQYWNTEAPPTIGPPTPQSSAWKRFSPSARRWPWPAIRGWCARRGASRWRSRCCSPRC